MEILPRERRIEQLLAQRFDWTERQRQVLDLVARGKSNAEIAETLGISLDGAKWHMREILSKLAVDSREDAAEYWRRASSLRHRLRRGLGPRALIRVSPAVSVAAASIAGAAALVALAVIPNGHDGDVAPGPSLVENATSSTPADLSPTPDDQRASLGGRVLAIESDHLLVERGDRQFVVRWTPDTTLLKADGAPTYQLATSSGLSRLRVGDSIDMVGLWTETAEFRADVVNANLWIHRPGIISAIGDTTIDLRIPQGRGAPFPDEATRLHIDRARLPWPPTKLAVGQQVEFEAAQADDGSLILTGIIDARPGSRPSPP